MADLQEDLNKIKSNESFFEKIKRIIPGYDGYVNKDNSRELDTIIRNNIASRLESNKVKIKNTVSSLLKTGKLFESRDIDKIDKKNENAIGKFRSAARGYSGVFDAVKVKEDKLAMLYNFDSGLLEGAEKICALFEELESKSSVGTDINETINNISAALDSLILKFTERENILRNI
ncbi:hypothetical protein D4R20_00775 [bacterium]|nr:MAG: hypothetical protein D4R20_00775 [bacterium]